MKQNRILRTKILPSQPNLGYRIKARFQDSREGFVFFLQEDDTPEFDIHYNCAKKLIGKDVQLFNKMPDGAIMWSSC